MFIITSARTGEILGRARTLKTLNAKCVVLHRRNLYKGGDRYVVRNKDGELVKLTPTGHIPIGMDENGRINKA